MLIKGLLFLTALTLSFQTLSAKSDPVVATVNGIKIMKSQLETSFQQNLLFVSDKVVNKEKVLMDLINRELGIKRAKASKLNKNPIVREKMEDILYHAQISKDLEPKFKRIVVTDKEVKTYYNSHKEYRTAHILFRMKANPDKNENKAALGQAMKVYKAIKKKPAIFAEMANKYSQSNTAPNGGDMGYQPSIRMAPEYFSAIKGKSKGFISPPVKTQFGYHIIKVMDIKGLKGINTGLYKKIVYDQKRDKIISDYFTNLRKNSKISINKQYLK